MDPTSEDSHLSSRLVLRLHKIKEFTWLSDIVKLLETFTEHRNSEQLAVLICVGFIYLEKNSLFVINKECESENVSSSLENSGKTTCVCAVAVHLISPVKYSSGCVVD